MNVTEPHEPTETKNYLSPLLALTLSLLFLALKSSLNKGPNVPTVHISSPWLPAIVRRIQYRSKASSFLAEGYRKYKNAPFRVQKWTGDVIVLPFRYYEELGPYTESKLNSIEANLANVGGDYSTGNIFAESRLHVATITSRLTPAIPRLVPRIFEELESAFELEFPQCKGEWVPVSLYTAVLKIVARISARVFVGEELCQNKDWLETSMIYTENVYITGYILNLFPTVLYPFIVHLLPSYWKVKQQVRRAKKLLSPVVLERRRQQRASPGAPKPDDFLQWMTDLAQYPKDSDAENLSHRQLITSLASIHTTTMAVVHGIYDLASHPEYVKPLREEMEQQLGIAGGDFKKFTKQNLLRLKLMDSFMKESQRMSPLTSLTFQHVVKQPITLSDGLFLPKGTYISMPAGPMSFDEAFLSQPAKFDPFRWTGSDATAGRVQYVRTGKKSMFFGHGRSACPGRFFAASEIKAMLCHFLLRYDFKFQGDQRSRPENWVVGEGQIPNPGIDVLFQEREEK